jgi:hypothetical protein
MTDMADFEADVPPVVPGSTVYIQLKHTSIRSTETGEIVRHLPAVPTPMVIHDRDECYPENWAEEFKSKEDALHCYTICPECIDQWATDYYVAFPTTLPDGMDS